MSVVSFMGQKWSITILLALNCVVIGVISIVSYSKIFMVFETSSVRFMVLGLELTSLFIQSVNTV